MYWLRSALLYLFVTLLLCAGIWLFWGEAISKKLQNTSLAARQEPAGRQAGPVKAKAPTATKEKAVKVPASAGQAVVSGKEAWERASSGFEVLLKSAAQDNRRLLVEAVAEHDRRYRALLFKPAEQRITKPAERQPSKPKAK